MLDASVIAIIVILNALFGFVQERRAVNLDANCGWARGKADVVFIDAPCSGIGALRRNPEARWRLRESDLADFAAFLGRLDKSLGVAGSDDVRAYMAAAARANSTTGVANPSLSPLSPLRMRRMRAGTTGLSTVAAPSPASALSVIQTRPLAVVLMALTYLVPALVSQPNLSAAGELTPAW